MMLLCRQPASDRLTQHVQSGVGTLHGAMRLCQPRAQRACTTDRQARPARGQKTMDGRREPFFTCGAPTSTVRQPSPEARIGPMVDPHAMSLRTQNSCVGMPRRRATSLRQNRHQTLPCCKPAEPCLAREHARPAGSKAAFLALPGMDRHTGIQAYSIFMPASHQEERGIASRL